MNTWCSQDPYKVADWTIDVSHPPFQKIMQRMSLGKIESKDTKKGQIGVDRDGTRGGKLSNRGRIDVGGADQPLHTRLLLTGMRSPHSMTEAKHSFQTIVELAHQAAAPAQRRIKSHTIRSSEHHAKIFVPKYEEQPLIMDTIERDDKDVQDARSGALIVARSGHIPTSTPSAKPHEGSPAGRGASGRHNVVLAGRKHASCQITAAAGSAFCGRQLRHL